MTTGSVIVGRAEAGLIVCTPAPEMSNVIVSRPGLALALRIACRSEPGPLSLVFVTVVPPRCPGRTPTYCQPGRRSPSR